jgi:hypothetical protein
VTVVLAVQCAGGPHFVADSSVLWKLQAVFLLVVGLPLRLASLPLARQDTEHSSQYRFGLCCETFLSGDSCSF